MALGVAEWGRLGRGACASADRAERRKDDDSQLHLEENILWLVQTERLSIATRQALILMLLTAVARVVLAGLLGLGVDESYEVVLSRVPSLSYFDHPPLSFWIAGAVGRVAGTEHRVLLRLPFILIFAGTTFVMFRLTVRLYGERAGFLAALLLNLAPVFSISAGGWILPDGPLELAIVATAFCLTRVLIVAEPARSGTSVASRP